MLLIQRSCISVKPIRKQYFENECVLDQGMADMHLIYGYANGSNKIKQLYQHSLMKRQFRRGHSQRLPRNLHSERVGKTATV